MPRKFDFESLAVAEKNQSIQDELNYQNLLREIAADTCARSDEDVLEILRRTGRDGKTLEEDAAKRAERDRMIAELSHEEEYRAESEKLSVELQRLAEEFKKFETEHEAKDDPLRRRRHQLKTAIDKIADYRSKLFENCPDTRLKLELDILRNQWDSRDVEHMLWKRRQEIETEIRHAKQELDKKILSPTRKEEERQLKAKIKELKTEFEQIEAKSAELIQKKAEHDAAVEKIKEQMIFA